jgi:hypothetical protein
MDINLPEPIESPELRVPGMYRITKPLPLTMRRIGLHSSKGKYTFSPSLANLKELNHVLRESFNQTAYFCIG